MTHIDRRSSKSTKPNDDRADLETRALTDAQDTVPMAKIGNNRRVLPGARTADDFFAPERFQRSISRADMINILGTLEFSRRESTPWRRFVRWWNNLPQVSDMPGALSNAHARSLAEAVKALEGAASEAK